MINAINMNTIKKSIAALVCATIFVGGLSGCMANGPKETGGRIIGGVTGALIGSQFGKGRGQLVGVAVGTLAGSFLGGALGQRMDQRDRAMADQAMREALEHAPDHQARRWRNPNTQHSGTVRVTRTVEKKESNLVCRDYVHTVIIDGQEERVHGRACRDMRDVKGEWFVKN